MLQGATTVFDGFTEDQWPDDRQNDNGADDRFVNELSGRDCGKEQDQRSNAFDVDHRVPLDEPLNHLDHFQIDSDDKLDEHDQKRQQEGHGEQNDSEQKNQRQEEQSSVLIQDYHSRRTDRTPPTPSEQ